MTNLTWVARQPDELPDILHPNYKFLCKLSDLYIPLILAAVNPPYGYVTILAKLPGTEEYQAIYYFSFSELQEEDSGFLRQLRRIEQNIEYKHREIRDLKYEIEELEIHSKLFKLLQDYLKGTKNIT